LVEEVRKLLVTHLRHNNISLTFNPTLDLPDIPIIRDQIKQVILNLCINAIESMPMGGQLTISSNYNMNKDEVRLAVRDNGPGIPESIQKKIFQPFFTTKEEGTGLGLSIASRIIKDHDGRLDVESRQGDGAMFIIRFPVREIHHE